MLSISNTILKYLLKDEDYLRKVKPFIQPEYFEGVVERAVFTEISEFVDKYNALPTKEALFINLSKNTKLSDPEIDKAGELILDLDADKSKSPQEWLIDQTEKWCKNQAIFNAVAESIIIIEDNKLGKSKKDVGILPELLSKALAVCFDPNVGHDYMEDSDARYDMYHEHLSRISWGIDDLDKITNKGIPAKSLSVLVGGVNVGKTLCLCHLAASFLKQGHNVLYITLEIAEKEVSRRIDANLLDIDMDEILEIPEQSYKKKFARLKAGVTGKLIVKEYPTATASATNFRFLLNELRLKKNIVPDVILIDYINICASSRVKVGNVGGSTYVYIKMIAEELRGLAVEFNTRVISATQLTRSGFSDSDPDMTDTAESFGLPATADFMLAIVNNEKLEAMNQYMMKQMKNRFGNSTKNKRFNIGVDRSRQRLYQLSNSAANVKGDDDGDDDKQVQHKRLRKVSNGSGKTTNPETQERLEISREHGSEAYKSAYSSGFSRQFGPRTSGLDKLKTE